MAVQEVEGQGRVPAGGGAGGGGQSCEQREEQADP